MADLKIGLDVRDVQQAAAIFQQALYDNGKVVDDFAVKLAEFNNKGKLMRGVLVGVAEDGKIFEAAIKKGKEGIQVKTVRVKESTDALKAFTDAQKAANAAESSRIAKEATQKFVQDNFFQNKSFEITPEIQNKITSAQQKIFQLFSKGQITLPEANKIFQDLERGFTTIETGAKRQAQQAVLSLISTFNKLETESDRAIKSLSDRIKLDQVRSLFTSQIPQNADPARVEAYRKAQDSLAKLVVRENVPIDQVRDALDQLNKGIVQAEIGVKSGLLSAVARVRDTFQSIVSNVDKTAEKLAKIQKSEVFGIKSQAIGDELRSIFPIPSGASVSQLGRYETAIQRIITLLKSERVNISDFGDLLNKFRTTDRNSFNTAPLQGNLNQARVLLNELASAFSIVQERGTNASQRILVSWQGLVRIFEVQIIHQSISGLVQGFTQAGNTAVEFSTKIAQIQTISQTANKTTADWSSELKKLSNEFGVPLKDVSEAAYQAISNQIVNGTNATRFLGEALAFARTTGATARESVDLLSSVINSYGLSALDAGRESAVLFKTIELGRVQAGDLANVYGRILPTANALGISTREVGAAVASITVQGTKPSEALTFFGNVLNHLLRPSKEMTQLFKEWGVDSGQAAIGTFGFSGVLQRLGQELSRGGITRLGELGREIRTIRGLVALTTNQEGLENFRQQIEDAGVTFNKAQQIVAQSPAAKFKSEVEKIRNAFTGDFGEQFLNKFLQGFEPVGGLSTVVLDLVEALTKTVNLALQFGSAFTQGLAGIQPLLPSLETIIKLTSSYGIALLGVKAYSAIFAAASAIVNASVSQNTQSFLVAAASKTSLTNSEILNTSATSANTGSVNANTAATSANVQAQLSSNAQLQIATIQRALDIGKITAHSAALQIAAVRQADFAAAQRASALSSLGFSVALTAVTYAITNMLSKSSEGYSALERLAGDSLQNVATQQEEAFKQQRDADVDAFKAASDEKSRIFNQYIAGIRVKLNEISEVTREKDGELLREFREAVGQIGENAQETVQTLTQKIKELETAVGNSQKQILNIRARSDTKSFERSLIGKDQITQTQLILDKVDKLGKEGVSLFNSDKIEEARKKFEEIETLLGRLYDRDKQFREQAQKLGVKFTQPLNDQRQTDFDRLRINLENQYQQRLTDRAIALRRNADIEREINERSISVENSRLDILKKQREANDRLVESRRNQTDSLNQLGPQVDTLNTALDNILKNPVPLIFSGVTNDTVSIKGAITALKNQLDATRANPNAQNQIALGTTFDAVQSRVSEIFRNNVNFDDSFRNQVNAALSTIGRSVELYRSSGPAIVQAQSDLAQLQVAQQNFNNNLPAQFQNIIGFANQANQAQLTFLEQINKNFDTMRVNLERIVEISNQLRAPQAAAQVPGFASGGRIGNDNQLAFLSKDEVVVNAAASRQFYPQLAALNSNVSPSVNSVSSVSNTYNFGDMNFNSNAPQSILRDLGNHLRREIRRSNLKL